MITLESVSSAMKASGVLPRLQRMSGADVEAEFREDASTVTAMFRGVITGGVTLAKDHGFRDDAEAIRVAIKQTLEIWKSDLRARSTPAQQH